MTTFSHGRKDGALAAAAGASPRSYGDSYFNDRGAQMEYRDGYTLGHRLWTEGQAVVIDGHAFAMGSKVKVLIGGRPQDVEVTHIYKDLTPMRFDAERIVRKNDDDYPGDDSDHKVWAFASDILEVTQY